MEKFAIEIVLQDFLRDAVGNDKLMVFGQREIIGRANVEEGWTWGSTGQLGTTSYGPVSSSPPFWGAAAA
jgi:hypothetical protein